MDGIYCVTILTFTWKNSIGYKGSNIIPSCKMVAIFNGKWKVCL